MSIKNKDGTIFKLSRPNPVMLKQDFWDDGSKFELHNFNQEEVILHNFDEPKDEHKVEEKPKPVKKKYQSIEDITPQEITVQVKETAVAPEHKVRKKQPQPTKNVALFYCMPATTNSSHDPLYNENRISVIYGQQFTFEGILTVTTDLALQIWTNKELHRGSILYQPRDRRWWKIEDIIQRTDGFVVDCVPSSIQPSFRLQP